MKKTYYQGIGVLFIISIGIYLTVSLASCKKYLDAKPDKSLEVPTTLDDLQAILDYSDRLNVGPSYSEASADNYYLTDDIYNSIPDVIRTAYMWENYSYDNYPNDWSRVYDVIYPANLVLQNIEKINPTSQTELRWNNIKGSALLFRAFSLLEGADIFCKVYDAQTATEDLGLVLRLNPDMNAKSVRSNLQETFDRILSDLKAAAPLLPSVPLHPFRPSKPAAYGLLARTYLYMREYDSCKKYADLSLNIKNDLIDYNLLATIGNSSPFPAFDNEVIMDNSNSLVYYFSALPYATVDTLLYKSYADDDLRKVAYFQNSGAGIQFKGSYSGNPYAPFIGLATDEVYLMRAECNARLGRRDSAMMDLNELMKRRWKNDSFVLFTAGSDEEALSMILTERRKELVFRNLRWMDIKRLNKEGANITLTRIVNGKIYTLTPNDNRYALPIPEDIINMTGMKQNPQ